MENQIQFIKCKKCNTKGLLWDNSICPECKGIGGTAYDGQNEYFIGIDKNGQPVIAGLKVKKENYQKNENILESPKQLKNSTQIYFVILFYILVLIGFSMIDFLFGQKGKLILKSFLISSVLLIDFLFFFLKIAKKISKKIIKSKTTDFNSHFKKI